MTIPTVSEAMHDPVWQALHRLYLDALNRQDGELHELLDDVVGVTLRDFLTAVTDGLLVVASTLVVDDSPSAGLNYVLGIRTSDGIRTLAQVHARRLGLDSPRMLATEMAVIRRRLPWAWPDGGNADPMRKETWPEDARRGVDELAAAVDEVLLRQAEDGDEDA